MGKKISALDQLSTPGSGGLRQKVGSNENFGFVFEQDGGGNPGKSSWESETGNVVTFRAPAGLGASLDLELPATAPTNEQVLTGSSTGVLSFQTPKVQYLKLVITSAELVSLTSGNPGQVNFIGAGNELPAGAIVKSVVLRVITLFTGGRTGVYNFTATAAGIEIVPATEISDFSGTLPLSYSQSLNQVGDPTSPVIVAYNFTSPGGVDEIQDLTAGELELLVEYFNPAAMAANGVVAEGF